MWGTGVLQTCAWHHPLYSPSSFLFVWLPVLLPCTHFRGQKHRDSECISVTLEWQTVADTVSVPGTLEKFLLCHGHRKKTHWETRAECDQKLFQRNISKWLQCSVLSAVLILLFWIDRECPEWIHLRLVCVCVHMWKCVFSSVFAHECVSKGKMWFELRPANRCLLAAQCFDSSVGLYTQCLLCRSGAFFSSPF